MKLKDVIGQFNEILSADDPEGYLDCPGALSPELPKKDFADKLVELIDDLSARRNDDWAKNLKVRLQILLADAHSADN